jgi:transcriptional regulator with XRE-family HTH domain
MAALLDRPMCQPSDIPRPTLTGQRLRELRELSGLTQQELADLLGYHWHHLSQIENGRRSVPTSVRMKLKSVLIKAMRSRLTEVENADELKMHESTVSNERL